MLLQGCAAEAIFGAVQVAGEVANAAARESTLQDALASRTYAHPPIVARPALKQAAQLDGRRIESGFGFYEGGIVSYAASPSTDGAAGSVTVRMYWRGQLTVSTTVIVLRGPTGSEGAGRKVGGQLLDAIAADLANIERRVATKTVAVDLATVFDALGQVGQRQGRKVLTQDAASHSLRVSPFFFEEGFLDITCIAAGGSTIVTIVGGGNSSALEVRKAANALLAALTELLHQPE